MRADGVVTARVARDAMALLQVDELGLDDTDHLLLRTLIEKSDGGPVGVKSLAVAISEDADPVEEVFVPFLIQVGFLNRTPQGRVATKKGVGAPGETLPRAGVRSRRRARRLRIGSREVAV